MEELRIKNHDTKNEVVEAYHELLNQLQGNKKGPQPLEQAKIEKRQVAEELANQTPEECEDHFENLKRSFLASLGELKDAYLEEQKSLSTLEEAIQEKKRELEELHSIQVNIDTLSALMLANSHKKDELQRKINEDTAAFERQARETEQLFEQEMAQKRREWQQEEQKYQYQRDLAREKDRNLYEIAKRNQQQELTAMRTSIESQLEEREARVAEKEREIEYMEELEIKVARFPAELQEAVQKAEDTITRQLTLQLEYETQLASKEIQLREQTIATLEARIALLEANISHFESIKNSFAKLSFSMMESAPDPSR